MPGLFDQHEAQHLDAAKPLAARMRPRTLDEFTGQQHFLGEGKLLRRMLQADRVSSVIFYGPPGTGKTSLAEIIAKHTKSVFASLNAASVGVKELREVLEAARTRLKTGGQRTLLFVDELHHFNKTQQDVLLPDVESGAVRLIGATTSNPFFALVSPLVSRSQVFEFRSLSREDVLGLMQRALSDRERGFGQHAVTVTDEALSFLAEVCDGDARRALNALEIAVLSVATHQHDATASGQSGNDADHSLARRAGDNTVDLEIAQESIQKKAVQYGDDEHYDAASAFIKSIRGSDPDAAIYWLARMLEAGEEPRFIARRIVIAASEDIGNADPQALVVAMAAAHATEFVGLPECRIMLAQAVTYLATAPKSNASYLAVDAALDDVRTKRVLPVPTHLRDGHYLGAKRLGHGEGYQYAHAAPDGWVDQDYLGVERTYYQPVDRGFEAELKRRVEEQRSRKQL
ncbi:MAG: replication-associated recombination protein A [Planctomycetota bacterium]|nr:MAG: replication-associated recombination protein A [Planctomycetota bacterium]GDY07234.1 ATPase AAA [Planctomycetia bacterium]